MLSIEDIQKPKPDPEIYLKSAERFKIPPNLCIVVEDSPVGLEAGKKAGMKTIALAHTLPKAELRADLIAGIFAQINIADIQKLYS